ncbi:predicted protein [Histoplasma capsulatum H143]|uniref:Uncharacterized protein n=1 Tax=Ajellomyces capsulatus (strain H143) TaxID=544712 RepID=C6HRZ1_AJECH|nr:predicted protein [Histoplasma capsulatum H143]
MSLRAVRIDQNTPRLNKRLNGMTNRHQSSRPFETDQVSGFIDHSWCQFHFWKSCRDPCSTLSKRTERTAHGKTNWMISAISAISAISVIIRHHKVLSSMPDELLTSYLSNHNNKSIHEMVNWGKGVSCIFNLIFAEWFWKYRQFLESDSDAGYL